MRDLNIVTENINSFVVRSLETALNSIGVSSKLVALKEGLTDEDMQDATLNVLVGCDEMEQYLYIIQAIRAKCHEYDKRVVSFGLTEENDFLRTHLTKDVLMHEFLRPMPPADLANGIKKVCDMEAHRKERPNVLVVDDSGLTLRTMMDWLEGDFIVRVANSAFKATPMIEEQKPDVILLDYEMPDCSGAEYFEMLKENEETNTIPVIFLTSKDDVATVRTVLELRPAGYVLKTSTKELLIERILEVLSK